MKKTPWWKRIWWGSRRSPFQRGYDFGMDCATIEELDSWMDYDACFDSGSQFGRGMRAAYRERLDSAPEDS